MFNQRRTYCDFVNSDCGNTFAEYIGIVAPFYELTRDWHTSKYAWRMRRRAEYGRIAVEGEIKPTKKEAKASYKEALAKHRDYQKQIAIEWREFNKQA